MEYHDEFGPPIEEEPDYDTSSAVPEDEESFRGESAYTDRIIVGEKVDRVLEEMAARVADPTTAPTDTLGPAQLEDFIDRNSGLIMTAQSDASLPPDPDFDENLPV